MASPHVAGVAARVAGNNPALTNVELFDRLLNRGLPSEVGVPIDVDGDGTFELGECWESGFDPPNTIGPGVLVDVNAATALGRGRVIGRLVDATTGLGLTGAAAQLSAKGRAVGFGGSIDTVGLSYFHIVNVPWNDPGTGAAVSPPYSLRISKKGYTAGFRTVEDPATGGGVTLGLSPVEVAGPFEIEKLATKVGVPPMSTNYTFVTDWGTTDTTTELDTYLWLPPLSGPSGAGCSLGFDPISGDCGPAGQTGTLLAYPFARWFRDGGVTDGLGTESTGIRSPLLSTKAGGGDYVYAVNDFAFGDGTGFGVPDANPVVRLWRRGIIRATVRFSDRTPVGTCIPDGGATPCDWWNVGTLTGGGLFTAVNALGDRSTVIPYSAPGGHTSARSRAKRPTSPLSTSLPALSVDDVSLAEGDGGTTDAVFTVSLSAPSAVSVTVDYASADGTAFAGSDYFPVAGTLTFAPLEISQTVTVPVVGDTVGEPDETFFLDLSNPSPDATIADAQGQATIANDEAFSTSLSVDNVIRAEGNAGGTGTFLFTVTLSAPSAAPVTVDYQTFDGFALAGSDYKATSGTLIFAPGITQQRIGVPVMGDRKEEPDEHFFVGLDNPVGTTLDRDFGFGIIVNDDGAGPPRLSVSDAAASEGDSGTASLVFTVRLSRASASMVIVHYATADGTATTSDGDYVPASGVLTFAPGATTRTVAVPVNGDTMVEPTETFLLRIFAARNAAILDGTGVGTIVDDDGP